MNWTHLGFAFASSVFACAAFAQDTEYRDPQGRFTLSVPASWTPTPSEAGVQFMRNGAYITVMVVQGQGTPQNMAANIMQMVGRQWRNFQSFDPESTTFAGRPGTFSMAKGVNPAGVLSFFACYAADDNGTGFLLLQSGAADQMQSLDAEMERVARSFIIGVPASAGRGAPQGKFSQYASPAGPGKPAPATTATAAGAAANNYTTPDGSLSLRVPAGWRAREMPLGGMPVQVLEPEAGDERIIVAALAASTNNIQELAQQAAQQVTQQLLPGSRLSSQPQFGQVNGAPSAELWYTGMAQAGQIVAFHIGFLKDQQAVGILGLVRPDRRSMIEQLCRGIAQSVQLRPAQPAAARAGAGSGSNLAQVIIGHWTWSHRTAGIGVGSDVNTSRELWFYPNGRYQYTYATYVPNMPADIDPVKTITGSYQIQGNHLYGQADNGQKAAFTIEVVNNTAIKIDGELYIRQ